MRIFRRRVQAGKARVVGRLQNTVYKTSGSVSNGECWKQLKQSDLEAATPPFVNATASSNPTAPPAPEAPVAVGAGCVADALADVWRGDVFADRYEEPSGHRILRTPNVCNPTTSQEIHVRGGTPNAPDQEHVYCDNGKWDGTKYSGGCGTDLDGNGHPKLDGLSYPFASQAMPIFGAFGPFKEFLGLPAASAEQVICLQPENSCPPLPIAGPPTPVLNWPIMPPNEIAHVIPLGSTGGFVHTFPVNHLYLLPKSHVGGTCQTTSETTVSAPADGRVTQINDCVLERDTKFANCHDQCAEATPASCISATVMLVPCTEYSVQASHIQKIDTGLVDQIVTVKSNKTVVPKAANLIRQCWHESFEPTKACSEKDLYPPASADPSAGGYVNAGTKKFCECEFDFQVSMKAGLPLGTAADTCPLDSLYRNREWDLTVLDARLLPSPDTRQLADPDLAGPEFMSIAFGPPPQKQSIFDVAGFAVVACPFDGYSSLSDSGPQWASSSDSPRDQFMKTLSDAQGLKNSTAPVGGLLTPTTATMDLTDPTKWFLPRCGMVLQDDWINQSAMGLWFTTRAGEQVTTPDGKVEIIDAGSGNGNDGNNALALVNRNVDGNGQGQVISFGDPAQYGGGDIIAFLPGKGDDDFMNVDFRTILATTASPSAVYCFRPSTAKEVGFANPNNAENTTKSALIQLTDWGHLKFQYLDQTCAADLDQSNVKGEYSFLSGPGATFKGLSMQTYRR